MTELWGDAAVEKRHRWPQNTVALEIPIRYPESSNAIIESICNTLPRIKCIIGQVQKLYNY